MQVSFLKNSNTINNFSQTSQQHIKEKQQPTDKTNNKEATNQKFFANNLATLGVSFKGTPNLDEEKTLTDLKDEYNWYVNHDKTRPLDAFLKIKTSKEKMNLLFRNILEDDNLSFQLIDDIAGRARESKANYKKLQLLLGENSDNLHFFSKGNPYVQAFEKYMDKKYNNAHSIEYLLKFRPDWREDALLNKYEQLTGSRSLKFGNIPDEFKEGRFEIIYDYLKQFQQSGFKMRTNIPPLTIGNRTYNFEYFTEGKTDKNVFGVYTPDKKYVFKMAPPERRNLNEPFALGTLALIDGYLTLNNCRNIAPLYYYDHDRNTCIYKYQNHNQVTQHLSSTNEVNYYMPDFQALGMCYNDTVGSDNYFLSDTECDHNNGMYSYSKLDRELISVDNDHCTYYSPFMLMESKYNIPLPNAMQTAF